jgi:hypothetical protein
MLAALRLHDGPNQPERIREEIVDLAVLRLGLIAKDGDLLGRIQAEPQRLDVEDVWVDTLPLRLQRVIVRSVVPGGADERLVVQVLLPIEQLDRVVVDEPAST